MSRGGESEGLPGTCSYSFTPPSSSRAPRVRRAWIYAKRDVKPEEWARLRGALESCSLQAAVHPSHASLSGLPALPASEAVRWADVVVAVGGDGALLRAYHETGGALPILGVSCRSVGYLMEVPLSRVEEAFRLIAGGEYWVEERMVGLASAGRWSAEFVNEVLVTPFHRERPARFTVRADGLTILQGRLDGLIVATPTGSTAYALSAGGPVLDPQLRAFSVVPLAPLTALAKPLVVSSSRRLEVAVAPDRGCAATIDGLEPLQLETCTVIVAEAPRTLKLVKLPIGEDPWTKLTRRLTDTPIT